VPKDFGESSTVCVCNATYCDSSEPLGDIANDQFIHIVTTKDGKRFERTSGEILEEVEDGIRRAELWIERRLQYQKIIGFGGGNLYTFPLVGIRTLPLVSFSFLNSEFQPLRTQPGLTC